MEQITLEIIKSDYENLIKNVLEYLVNERKVYSKNDLENKNGYELFSLYLQEFLKRLAIDFETEANCLPAVKANQYAMRLGWVDEGFNLLGKELKEIVWKKTSFGNYEIITYTNEEQKEIERFLNI